MLIPGVPVPVLGGIAAVCLALVLSFYGGWALVALFNRDGEGQRQPQIAWIITMLPAAFLAQYGIYLIEQFSGFSFGYCRWCVFVLLGNAVGFAACLWKQRHFAPD
jgi:hypothetical protein